MPTGIGYWCVGLDRDGSGGGLGGGGEGALTVK